MYKLYDYLPSGNGYKVRLLMTQLGVPFELVELDIIKGETRTPEFLQKNPDGRIPVLELELNVYLSQSNAILIHLSEGTEFLPRDRLQYAPTLTLPMRAVLICPLFRRFKPGLNEFKPNLNIFRLLKTNSIKENNDDSR